MYAQKKLIIFYIPNVEHSRSYRRTVGDIYRLSEKLRQFFTFHWQEIRATGVLGYSPGRKHESSKIRSQDQISSYKGPLTEYRTLLAEREDMKGSVGLIRFNEPTLRFGCTDYRRSYYMKTFISSVDYIYLKK